jgi:endonuclease/exonuclease/phosphatase family metal-dependent hydrolase
MPLSVLSYNVWGIFISKFLEERTKAISQRLAQYDIVCLQEQFEERHCSLLFSDREHFKYVERFVSCEYGSGLTIASRYPIVATMFLPFYSCGRPERINEGDFIANKGIAAVRIAVPASVLEDSREATNSSGDVVEIVVCNTHFVAQYEKYATVGGFFKETNAASRLTEAFEMADLACLLHGTADQRTPIILCGDYNAGQDSHEMKLLHDLCQLKGVRLLPVLQPDAPTFTSDNSYVKATTNEAIPIQIDHILYCDLEMSEGKVAFNEKVKLPGLPASSEAVNMSDHYAVSAVFTKVKPASAPSSPRVRAAQQEMRHVASYLRQNGERYNNHFRVLGAVAALIFGVSAAGWVTTHPLVTSLAGFFSCLILFIAVGHRRHEAEYYHRVAGNLEDLLKQHGF